MELFNSKHKLFIIRTFLVGGYPCACENGETIEDTNVQELVKYICEDDSNELIESSGEQMLVKHPCAENCCGTIQKENAAVLATNETTLDLDPYVGMEFASEDDAKIFYDAYATRVGFIMRVDTFKRSRHGNAVSRRLVCNKEGFRKSRPKQSEGRKPRAITREGCKAAIVVRQEKTGKWVVTRFIKEHTHPLVVSPTTHRRSVILSQTPDEKDVKIRELTSELHQERKRSAVIQEQLNMVLNDMEELSNHLSRKIESMVQKMREIESNKENEPKRVAVQSLG